MPSAVGASALALVSASLAAPAALVTVALPALLLPGALATALLLLLIFSALIVVALGSHTLFLILLIGHAGTPSLPHEHGVPSQSKPVVFVPEIPLHFPATSTH